MNKKLSIIIPAFNESKRILKNLFEIDDYISKKLLSDSFSVLVVNDGSTDDTYSVVKKWIEESSKNKRNFSILSYEKNGGKGFAVKSGFLNSSSELVLYTDADGASPIQEVEKLMLAIDEGFDVVCGSRILKSDLSSVEMSLNRRFIGLVFHRILSILKLNFIKDTQCGFKLFKTDVAKKLANVQRCYNFSFDIEYLFLAKTMNCKIKEVPINWYHIKGSKVNLIVDSIKMFVEVLKIRFIYKYNI